MCLAIPAKVLAINDKNAKVDFGGEKRIIKLGLVKPKIGDYVLISSGIAIEIISEENVRTLSKIIRG